MKLLRKAAVGLFRSSWVLPSCVSCILLAAIYAHLVIAKNADLYVGWLAPVDRLFDLVLALCLITIARCVGRCICRLLRLDSLNLAEELAFSIYLGTGTIGLGVLCLGLVGLLRPWSILLLITTFLVVSHRDVYEIPKLTKRMFRAATVNSQRRILVVIGLCVFTVFIARAEVPPNAPDESIYHLAVPSDFVRAGKVFPSYDNSLGNLPFLIHMIYAVCLLARSDIAAKLFSLFLALTVAIALYGFCASFLNRRVGVVALFAFFAGGMIVEVAVTTRIDVTLAGMLFLATYAMMNYLKRHERAWLWVSAVIAGFSLGVKTSAAVWLLFVGILYLAETAGKRWKRIPESLKLGLMYTVIAVAVASPWYLKNFIWFRNPFYPMFTGEVADFGSWGVRYFDQADERKLEAHFINARSEIPDIAASQQTTLAAAVQGRINRHPFRLWELFTRPNAYLMGEPLHYPNYLFLLVPAVVLLRPSRQLWWLLGLSVAFVLVMNWTALLARFLVPAYPSLTVLAAYVLVELGTRLKQRFEFGERITTYAVVVALTAVLAGCMLLINGMNTVAFLSGRISRRDFLLSIPSYHSVDFINRETPRDARILCFGVQVNYEINRERSPDETWFQTKWRRLLISNDSLEKLNESLKRQGYTHVLYYPELLEFAAGSGLQGSGGMGALSSPTDGNAEARHDFGQQHQLLRNWTTFTDYRLKFLEVVYADANGYEVLKIKK